MGEEHLTLSEAADRLGVHYMTAYRYVRLGRLPARRRGQQWEVRAADLTALLNDRPSSGPRTTHWPRHRQRLRDRLLAADEAGAWAVVETVLSGGAAPQDAYLELLAPVLEDIGQGWEQGRLEIAQEHAASSVAGRVVARLGPRFARPGRDRGTVILAAAPGETHWLPVALLADVLRGGGWRVVDLGSNTPDQAILHAAREADDDLIGVGVSIACRERLPTAGRTLEALRRALPGVPILVGGPAVKTADDATSVKADGWAPDARCALELLDSMGLRRGAAKAR